MNAHEFQQSVLTACQRIAPTWPLDQLIAVNPWWELRQLPIEETAARLAALGKVRCLMPKTHFQQVWRKRIQPAHLLEAAQRRGIRVPTEDLLEHLRTPDCTQHWKNVSDLVDERRDLRHRMSWQEEITQQISQFCAGFFQPGSPFNGDAKAETGLYRDWLTLTRQDRGIEILMACDGLRERFVALPEDRDALIQLAVETLCASPDMQVDYFHALLLDINGWASWVAYGRWQAQLENRTSHALMADLLAVRLAWELVLWQQTNAGTSCESASLGKAWTAQCHSLPELIQAHRDAQRLTWVWQQAAELAYQNGLQAQLCTRPSPQPEGLPQLQAVFCIDVRSEPLRRALEAQSDRIETRGFAGFFGLPIAYQPVGTEWQRPQLPGLLKPALTVTESQPALDSRQRHRYARSARWQACNEAAPASFSLVETLGLVSALKLFRDAFFPRTTPHPAGGMQNADRWQVLRSGELVSTVDLAELCAGILSAMGLTERFAPTVMLVGHGSSSRNNPHAAGLDCGACGGQSGELNVRVLVQLLNDPDVRDALRTQHRIGIPQSTRFMAALHNTTTDELGCLDDLPDEAVSAWLQAASQQARQERAPRLKIGAFGKPLTALLQRRACDWSQTRPEWGLANNACFVVAPRQATRHVNFGGRSFLHDYDAHRDEGDRILEQIMTAPMVVTHWINMQYNASVTDPRKFGSGNKVLHNVVGGHLGVFEGNGGDLRIGLPLQSVHDGQQWMHQVLRLSVFISAPRDAISRIVAKHRMLQDLVNNEWLFLFQWDPDASAIARYERGNWAELKGAAQTGAEWETDDRPGNGRGALQNDTGLCIANRNLSQQQEQL